MPEIEQIVRRGAGKEIQIIFTPHLIPMDRGILTTTYSKPVGNVTEQQLLAKLREFYANEPFVRVVDHLPGTKDTNDTNFCDITLRLVRGRVLTISCLDNLIKGASGAAVQNFNLLYGFPETTALLYVRALPIQLAVAALRFFSSNIMSIKVPQGFRAAGVYAGIKRNPTRQDVALVVSDRPAAAAGVYTKNLVFAAPVAYDKARTPVGRFSGGGDQFGQCQRLHRRAGTARRRGNGPTGSGHLRRERGSGAGAVDRHHRRVHADGKDCEPALSACSQQLGNNEDSLVAAARGMMTTDTVHKLAGRSGEDRREVDPDNRHGQGSGDDRPEYGHDAWAGADRCRDCRGRFAADAFGRGRRHFQLHQRRWPHEHQRHGAAVGQRRGRWSEADRRRFRCVPKHIASKSCAELAKAIPADGEGATHLICIDVRGCATTAGGAADCQDGGR